MSDAIPNVPTLDELVDALAAVREMDDADQVIALRRLAVSMPRYLAAYADAATFALTRHLSQSTAATRVGVSVSQVERAITRHRQRVGLRAGELVDG